MAIARRSFWLSFRWSPMTSALIPSTHRATFAIGNEQTAKRVVDLLTESFFEGQAAIAAFERPGDGRWDITVHFAEPPDEASIRELVRLAAGDDVAEDIAFDTVEARDWVKATLEDLVPVRAGRFIVHGRHHRSSIPPNKLGIEIEAALAFGTGHHGTTRGCLLALDRICKSPGKGRCRWILDLGTGSGVLAIAAARALRRRVLATDIDAAAVRVAHANVRINGVGTMIEVVKADGVAARSLRRHAPFDLVFANILLRPLQRIAAPLRKLTAPGARIVLSGLLPAQANAAIAAYRGFALERRLEIEGWTTLVLARRAQSAGVAGRRPTQ